MFPLVVLYAVHCTGKNFLICHLGWLLSWYSSGINPGPPSFHLIQNTFSPAKFTHFYGINYSLFLHIGNFYIFRFPVLSHDRQTLRDISFNSFSSFKLTTILPSDIFSNFFMDIFFLTPILMWTKKGPHSNPDKLRGGLTNSETESNHIGWFEIKTSKLKLSHGR